MSKKLVFSVLVSSLLLLTSCGTKPLGTFEEEIKAEQLSYAKNVDKFFEKMDGLQEGKFSSKGELKASFDSPIYGKGEFAFPFNSKSIYEKDKIAFELDLDAVFKLKTVDESKIVEEYKEQANSDVNYDLKAKVGFVDGVLYSSLKKMSLDFKSKKEETNKKFEEDKKELEKQLNDYIGKFYSFDFAKLEGIDVLAKEFNKSFALQEKQLKLVREGINLYLTGDVFSKAEKVTYNEKEAYKFKFDAQKLEKHNIETLKVLFEKHKEAMTELGITKEKIDYLQKSYEENSKDPKYFEEINEDFPYIYLTRAKDKGVNIHIDLVEKAEKPGASVEKSFLEILESEIKFYEKKTDGDEGIMSFKADSSGKISYLMDFNEKGKPIKIDGDFIFNRKGDSLDQKITLNISLPEDMKELDHNSALKKGGKVNFSFNSTTKKDDSIKITKESITENSKEIISLNDLFAKEINFLWGIYGRALNGAINLDEGAYDDMDFDLSEEVEVEIEEASTGALKN